MDKDDIIIEPDKKKNILVIVLVILGVVVLGLIGWIVYGKMSNKAEEPNNNEVEKTNNEETTSDTEKFECVLEDLSGDILNYPTKNDDTVTKTVEKKNTTDEDEMMQTIETLKYKDYTIVYTNNHDADGLDTLEVKDSTGKTIYSTTMMKVAVSGQVCKTNEYEYGKHADTVPTITGGKLYFINLSDTCYEFEIGSNWPYFAYNYIDLDNNPSKVVNIQNMKLMMEGEWPEESKCMNK